MLEPRWRKPRSMSLFVRGDDRALQPVSFGVTHSSGREVPPLSEGNICGSVDLGYLLFGQLSGTDVSKAELLRSLRAPT